MELALEGLTPFAVAQLSTGTSRCRAPGGCWSMRPIARKFTVEDAEAWAEADVVLPEFAACLGLCRKSPIRCSSQGRIASRRSVGTGATRCRRWCGPGGSRPNAPAGERAAMEAELAAPMKGFPVPVKVAAQTEMVSRIGDRGLEFSVGGLVSRFDSTQLDAMDVRDKADLAAGGATVRAIFISGGLAWAAPRPSPEPRCCNSACRAAGFG